MGHPVVVGLVAFAVGAGMVVVGAPAGRPVPLPPAGSAGAVAAPSVAPDEAPTEASPVSTCASSIPSDVVALARTLEGYVVCRAAATGQDGHVEVVSGRLVIEARPGRRAEDYAETATRLARRLLDEREGHPA